MPDGCISRFDRKRQSGYKAMIVFIDLTAQMFTTTIKSGKDTLGRLPDCFFKTATFLLGVHGCCLNITKGFWNET